MRAHSCRTLPRTGGRLVFGCKGDSLRRKARLSQLRHGRDKLRLGADTVHYSVFIGSGFQIRACVHTADRAASAGHAYLRTHQTDTYRKKAPALCDMLRTAARLHACDGGKQILSGTHHERTYSAYRRSCVRAVRYVFGVLLLCDKDKG